MVIVPPDVVAYCTGYYFYTYIVADDVEGYNVCVKAEVVYE